MIVDAVSEVTTIPAAAVEPVSAVAGGTREGQVLHGVARLEDRLVLLLNMDRVMAGDDLAALMA